MSVYEPLQQYLENLPIDEWNATFSEIEKIIGRKLPQTANGRREWWSNNTEGHTQARAWVESGWMTEDVNLLGKTLTFRRISKSDSSKGGAPAANVYGCLKGSVTILGDYDLTSPLGDNWGLGANG